MKKVLSILFLLTVLSAGVYAQGVSGGVKLGLNMANQTLSGNGFTTSPSFLPGFHAGGYLTMMFTEHLGLQPEVLYSGQGAKNGSYKLKLGYITVPVLVRFNINDIISFHLGPQIGVLTSAKAKIGSDSQDVKDGFKTTDVGVALGGAVDLPMGLNFNLRFIKGFSDINDDDSFGSDYKEKNYNIQVSVGYKLFGKK
jgi:hypothetical protein